MPFRAEKPRQAEIETSTGRSEDCGKRHEKTSTTDGAVWIVRGDGATCGWTSPGARTNARAGTNQIAPTGASACTTGACEDRAAEYSECGRQRGHVYNDLRAVGSGFPIERQLRQLDGVPGADEGALAPATGPGSGSGAGILPPARTAGSRRDAFQVFVVWPGVWARPRVSASLEAR